MKRTLATFGLGVAGVVGLAGPALAAITMYDDFPGTTLDTSKWTLAGSASVADSVLTIGDPGAWSSVYSTQTFSSTTQQGYFFKVTDSAATSGWEYFGIRDASTGHYAWIRKPGDNTPYLFTLDVTGVDEPGNFQAAPNDVIELRRTATNWQVYKNGVFQLQSVDHGILDPSDSPRFFMAIDPSHSCSFDYVAYGIAEPPNQGWKGDWSGSWQDSNNWNGSIPNGADAVANFGDVIASPQTVYTNAAVTVGTLKFDSPNSYMITGQGSLTVQTSAGTGSVSVLQGSHKINLPSFFASSTDVTVAGGATLTIGNPMTIRAGQTVTKSGAVVIQAPLTLEALATLVNAAAPLTLFGAPTLGSGAKVDLKNTSMTVDYGGLGSVGTAIRNQIASGGIMSSSATATTGLGWKDDSASQSVLVKYTYLGDTNLDGQVDVIDLGNLATAWQTSGVWANGDSNYDNTIDVIDLGLLATNWQAGVGSPLGPGSLDQALAAYGLPSVAVPEPASLGLIGLVGCAMLARKRR